MDRPMTCTWRPLDASSSRSALVFFRLFAGAFLATCCWFCVLSLRVAANRPVLTTAADDGDVGTVRLLEAMAADWNA